MTSEANNLFGDVISSYSRAQALEDGELIDLRQPDLDLAEVIANAGIKYPIACTRAVWESCIALTPAAKRAHNDVKGRLWDVLWMLKDAIRLGRDTNRISFVVFVVRDRITPTQTHLVAVCGPGDDAAPVITIMFPEED